ncbi:MAG TPA: 16S rRNA (cytosine(1402)-N(4))-methyltransferase RsmH [Steroidobacteraceae bacterium]|nr:16S rRNA (cytosine(1402)-N(4))-methyltransferase RsmH [Steroidobacteraceae bacterium]
MGHAPVLLDEALVGLAVRPDGYYLDATYGRGGHARAILMKLGPTGRLCAVDRDPEAVASAQQALGSDQRVRVVHGNYRNLAALVPKEWAERGLDGVLFDLGVSSPQLDSAQRGFSFMEDGPLDMRMDPASGESAARWLARVHEEELARVLRELGEERFARRIARAIVARRRESPIARTSDLAAIVAAAVRTREPGKHPATRSFQAIRIHINEELESLSRALTSSLKLLATHGRLVVISFHSLEDRAVKLFMRRHATVDPVYAGLPVVPARALPVLRLVGKAVKPAEAEVAANPRARSAVLRVAERLTQEAA